MKKDTSRTSQYTYQSLDFFMIRCPIFSNKDLIQIFPADQKTLSNYANHEMTREAIAVASLSLHRELDHIASSPKAKIKFFQYLLRMTTRCTPFGLFSGVADGKFNSTTQLQIESYTSHQKRARPDMGWLFEVLKKIEEDFNAIQNLYVSMNEIAYVFGDRAYLSFRMHYGQAEKNRLVKKEECSIRYSEAAKKIFECVQKEKITLGQLFDQICERFPSAKPATIQNYIHELLKKEFLISSLRPPVSIADPFDYVVTQLMHIHHPFAEVLKQIQKDVAIYNQIEIGKGEENYKHLIQNMLEIQEHTSPLQVDMKLSMKKCELSFTVADEIHQSAEVLWKLSSNAGEYPHLKEYHQAFIEKYGLEHEIPVLELLGEEKGLGAPASYEFPKGKRRAAYQGLTKEEQKVQDYLRQILFESYHHQRKEIKLTEKMVEKLSYHKTSEQAPDSLEVYAEFFASPESQEDFTLVMSSVFGSDGVGKTFGRFLDMLDPVVYEKIQQAREQEQTFWTDTTPVEGNYLTPVGRSLNVCVVPTTYKAEMAIGLNASPSCEQVHLQDILVGVTLEGWYLKSRKTGKPIRIISSNVLNVQQAPNVYRFLREVSMDNIYFPRPFTWLGHYETPFLPRITYQKSILSLATWNVEKRFLDLPDKRPEDHVFKTYVDKWRKKWDVPRYVCLTHVDWRIYLDLDHDLHLLILKNELYQMERLQLREIIDTGDQFAVQGAEGQKYMAELVVPLIKTKNQVVRKTATYPYVRSVFDERIPGSDWLFIKLYTFISREDELISQYLPDLCASVETQYFFMRYHDPERHIRLRFHGDPQDLCERVLPLVSKWVKRMKEQGLIKNMQLDTYTREVARYGGPTVIDAAEAVFHQDSNCVIKLLSLEKDPDITLPMITALSVLHIFETWGLDENEQWNWLNRIVPKTEYDQDFRKVKNKMKALALPDQSFSNLKSEYGLMYEAFECRVPALQWMRKKVDEAQPLLNFPSAILESIVHLHCNRMMGVNQELERKALLYARACLDGRSYWRAKVHGETK